MASIDKAALAAYRQSLDRVCSGAGNAAMDALGEWLDANPGASIEECREAAIAIAGGTLEVYGDASSSLACDLFDSVMEAEGVAVPAAQMYEGVREGAVEGTVRRVVGDVDGSQVSLDAFTQAVGQLVERETRLAASTTVEENVERVAKTKEGRDVRYARVPTRAVPCEWCAMLASRGFVYRSAERADAASHHHCTCTIVPGVEGVTEVAGYDPGHYYDVWQHPERYEGEALASSGIDWPDHVKPITNDQFKELRELADNAGIKLRGFRHAGIDPEAARSHIEAAARMLDRFPELREVDGRPLTIRLSGMLSDDFAGTGYDGDYSVIRISEESLRSKEALEREYGRLASERWFVEGTTSESVIFHEMGHIYCHVHGVDVSSVVHDALMLDGSEALSYLEENLSQYSASFFDFREVVSEAFAGYYGNSGNEVAAAIVEGVLGL